MITERVSQDVETETRGTRLGGMVHVVRRTVVDQFLSIGKRLPREVHLCTFKVGGWVKRSSIYEQQKHVTAN